MVLPYECLALQSVRSALVRHCNLDGRGELLLHPPESHTCGCNCITAAQGNGVFLLASQSSAVSFTGIVMMLILLSHYRVVYRLLKMHLRALKGGGRSSEHLA